MPVLYIIPTPISDFSIERVIPSYVISIIHHLRQFVVEDIRSARRIISKLNHPLAIDQLQFKILNEHTSMVELSALITYISTENTGLMSEAGLPCLADPGSHLVRLAHERKIDVVPLPGPCSIFMGLISSGLNGQSFSFAGYLPVKNKDRRVRLRDLEKRSTIDQQTQIFIETPYRNMQLLNDIVNICKPDTLLTIAAGITGSEEYIKTKYIKQWKKKLPDIHKIPAVFLLQA